MSNTSHPIADPGDAKIYQIRVKGHLGPQWTDWFAGMTIVPEENGDTLVTGTVVDQAALHGLLRKARDLGVPLLSIMRVEPNHDHAPQASFVGEERCL